ncbi:coiled-coil domain-containing protein 57-like isoform X2 [Haliotis rubra]|uniref:coiled-coil domain-containing protein 57-like isoform X2 n=1 Tax=Haliotis rubra TaxID=36100 RepID=UPI001EE52BCA|nr:coiled-coil domain-containing protein 57-like isoform X2 [Haliotis rubra]
MADQDPASWRELAEQKEREWKEASQKRVESLEKACREKEQSLAAERTKLTKLKEDFKYNLKLLEERDQELQAYDANFTELRAHLSTKTAEVSELKIRLDDMKKATQRETQAMVELQAHYQHRLRERHTEVDSFKTSKTQELDKERAEFETFRRKLQLRLKEVEEELDTQKRELSTGFEEALKRREHEFRVKADEMGAKVLEYELKAKLLDKELEMVKSSQNKQRELCKESESHTRQLEKAVKERDWAIKDVTVMKDARISELETKLRETETGIARLQEDFQRKFSEMDLMMREKEGALGKVKDACVEREEKLQTTARELQSQLEDQQIEIRRLEWQNQDLSKDRDVQITKLREELESQQEKWERHLGEVSHSQVSRDVELEALRERESKFQVELQQKKQDIDRYKRDLSQAAEREASLERSKAQLELDWQRRLEDAERHQYDRSEDLIKKLTSARDQAVAEVREKLREMEQKDMLINTLQRDRNIAMATLKHHGIPINKNINVDSSVFEEESRHDLLQLQEQNDNLREVIRQMREQMEDLGHNLPTQPGSPTAPSRDYVASLEQEVTQLKQKLRKLKEELEAHKMPGVASHAENDDIMVEVKDNTVVRNHIQMLNNMLGSVRSEKVELTAQVRKQQARIQYLEGRGSQLEKQPRQKQVEIDQLQYEVNAGKRRHEAEVAGLRSRVSDLEQQLVETRKEADEYYRSCLERNTEVTALSNELSAMKMEISERRPAVNFGAQELVIQQLQDEILRLKQKGSGITSTMDSIGMEDRQGETTQVSELRAKLKQAVKHISQLAKEKQQLIEIGNRLRAELKKSAGNTQTPLPMTAVRQETVSPGRSGPPMESRPNTDQYHSKLQQLEALQYQLTKQELQYAQRHVVPVMEYTDRSLDDIPTRHSTNPHTGHLEQTSSSLGDTQQTGPQGVTSDHKLLLSMSSAGGESLQEIWRMLDERQSPGIFTPKTPRSRADIMNPPSPNIRVSPRVTQDKGLSDIWN